MFQIRHKIIALVLLLISFPNLALAELKISNWDEQVRLTKNGREADLTIRAQIINLAKNYHQSGFGISFATANKMSIKSVKVDGAPAKYSFQNNSLNISFTKPKSNNQWAIIDISYNSIYDEIDQYLRHEEIYVPNWAAGALANIEVSYLWSLKSATLNPNVKELTNKFIYNGIVPKNGISETVKLTNAVNGWNVVVKHVLKVTGSVADMKISVPFYFVNGGQQQVSYNLISEPLVTPVKENNQNVFHFTNLKNQNVGVKIEAQINTGETHRTAINKYPSDYLYISDEDKSVLFGMLQKIKADQSTKDFPLYARIGKYVNQFIKYDRSLVGRRSNLSQILQDKKGVCTEYAKLYNALARLAGIPSMVVNGVAYGEYKSFEGHSWNMIYHNNRWIHVDPTWDLMSGIVSSSHIYFYEDDGKTQDFKLEWSAVQGKGNVEIANGKDFEVRKIW